MKLPTREELENRYKDYSDDQILGILKHEQDYQPLSVDVAREIALQRGLSCNEKLPSLIGKKRLFPIFNDRKTEAKMFQSLMRILYLFTIIPLVITILSYFRNPQKEFLIWGIISIGWILSVIFITKYKSKIWAISLFILYIFSVVFGVMSFGKVHSYTKIGMVIYVIAFLTLMYVISYIFVILCRRTKN